MWELKIMAQKNSELTRFLLHEKWWSVSRGESTQISPISAHSTENPLNFRWDWGRVKPELLHVWTKHLGSWTLQEESFCSGPTTVALHQLPGCHELPCTSQNPSCPELTPHPQPVFPVRGQGHNSTLFITYYSVLTAETLEAGWILIP